MFPEMRIRRLRNQGKAMNIRRHDLCKGKIRMEGRQVQSLDPAIRITHMKSGKVLQQGGRI